MPLKGSKKRRASATHNTENIEATVLTTRTRARLGKKARTESLSPTPSSDEEGPSQPPSPAPAIASANSNNTSDPLRRPHPLAPIAESHSLVQRAFYPPEMSNARCAAYTSGELTKPIDELAQALASTATERAKLVPSADGCVVHWFRTDLRASDNSALARAAQAARSARKSKGGGEVEAAPIVALYMISPQDWEAHLTAPVRADFLLRSLAILRKDLAALDIPMWVETVQRRRDIVKRVLELCRGVDGVEGTGWGATHLFANAEYEVDELRRDAKLVTMGLERGLSVDVLPDTCIVEPGRLVSGSGKQYAVYTPWYRSWIREVYHNVDELLDEREAPVKNPKGTREDERFKSLFDCEIPQAPEGMRLPADRQIEMEKLWPAGEHEALKRLEVFCEKKIGGYADRRNIPGEESTSGLSPHLAAGTIAARTVVRMAMQNNNDRLEGGDNGTSTWISEVAWRDFYRHVMVGWPFVCMNKPFKAQYSNISWSYDTAAFDAWKEGRTGFPLVDAAMRQLTAAGWMHNRCRMVVSSFLTKDLLLDWRLGERHFMLHLVDGDFASNNGGWGFGSGVGVDPQPYFRIFNPLLQSERFDPDGEYIRRWVPELRGVAGKAIHDPYGRGQGDKAENAGYPKPIVEHAQMREKAIKMYKEGLEKSM